MKPTILLFDIDGTLVTTGGVGRRALEIAAELPAAADRVIETEQALLRWVRSDDFDPDRLAEMRARH